MDGNRSEDWDPAPADGGGHSPLRRLNLNLLFALDAILRAPSLTEAAALISLSQPAMSLSLKRLREHFADELVIYRKGARRLTPMAQMLRTQVGRALRQASAIFSLKLDFDPAIDDRLVTIAAPEAMEIVYVSRVVSAIMRAAPRLRVQLVTYERDDLDDLFDRGVDLTIVSEASLDPDLTHVPLFEHTLACLVWNEHPLAPGERSMGKGARASGLTPARYRAARHAAVVHPSGHLDSIFGPLPRLMKERNIVVRTDRYAALANLVEGTDLIITTSTWVGQYLASHHPFAVVPTPFRRSPIMMYAQWEAHRTDEPFIAWLLEHFQSVARKYGL